MTIPSHACWHYVPLCRRSTSCQAGRVQRRAGRQDDGVLPGVAVTAFRRTTAPRPVHRKGLEEQAASADGNERDVLGAARASSEPWHPTPHTI